MTGVQVFDGDGIDRVDRLVFLHTMKCGVRKSVECPVCEAKGYHLKRLPGQRGLFKMPCARCHGTGVITVAGMPCEGCRGHGEVRRMTYDGQDLGKEPCPTCGGIGTTDEQYLAS
jgi:DnaJ-class molecular chaperone